MIPPDEAGNGFGNVPVIEADEIAGWSSRR
jgi:hypothetical protein